VAKHLTDKAHHSVSGAVLLVLIVVIAAPIVEELFYRGLLLRSLERRVGNGWAVVWCGLIFGASHFELLQLPALAVFGMVLALLAQRSGRLGPSIFAHMAFNGVTVFALLSR
jgi:membrane protease YdiL (CAAX protease family)